MKGMKLGILASFQYRLRRLGLRQFFAFLSHFGTVAKFVVFLNGILDTLQVYFEFF